MLVNFVFSEICDSELYQSATQHVQYSFSIQNQIKLKETWAPVSQRYWVATAKCLTSCCIINVEYDSALCQSVRSTLQYGILGKSPLKRKQNCKTNLALLIRDLGMGSMPERKKSRKSHDTALLRTNFCLKPETIIQSAF